jgi:hypothetical protein
MDGTQLIYKSNTKIVLQFLQNTPIMEPHSFINLSPPFLKPMQS